MTNVMRHTTVTNTAASGSGANPPPGLSTVISVDKGTAFALPVGRRPRRSALVHLHVPGDDSVILRVASKAVVAWPPRRKGASAPAAMLSDPHALYVCPSFARDGRCPRAEGACPYVHVPLAEEHTTRLYPHRRCHAAVAAAAAKTSDGGDAYRRFGAEVAGSLLVTAPNGTVAGMSVAAAECLATRALDGGHDGALSLCAHYMGPKAVCDYGAECKFVHPAPGAQVLRRHACDGPALVAKAPAPHAPSGFVNGAITSAASLPTADRRTLSHFEGATASASTARYRHDPYERRGWVGSKRGEGLPATPRH
jgi:hypothetical protein